MLTAEATSSRSCSVKLCLKAAACSRCDHMSIGLSGGEKTVTTICLVIFSIKCIHIGSFERFSQENVDKEGHCASTQDGMPPWRCTIRTASIQCYGYTRFNIQYYFIIYLFYFRMHLQLLRIFAQFGQKVLFGYWHGLMARMFMLCSMRMMSHLQALCDLDRKTRQLPAVCQPVCPLKIVCVVWSAVGFALLRCAFTLNTMLPGYRRNKTMSCMCGSLTFLCKGFKIVLPTPLLCQSCTHRPISAGPHHSPFLKHSFLLTL